MVNNLQSIFNQIKVNGGITLDSRLNPVKVDQGYAVSLPQNETTITDVFFTFNVFESLVKLYSAMLPDNCFIGIWQNENKVYFDISKIVQDQNTAIELGKQFKQLAIFDFSQNKAINL